MIGQRMNKDQFGKAFGEAKRNGKTIDGSIYTMAGKTKDGKRATGMTQKSWRQFMVLPLVYLDLSCFVLLLVPI